MSSEFKTWHDFDNILVSSALKSYKISQITQDILITNPDI